MKKLSDVAMTSRQLELALVDLPKAREKCVEKIKRICKLRYRRLVYALVNELVSEIVEITKEFCKDDESLNRNKQE